MVCRHRSSPARTLPDGWWGSKPPPIDRPGIVQLIDRGVLDAELAALVWLLFAARVPLLVAGEASGTGRTTLLTAFLDLLPERVRTMPLGGERETFERLPEAVELGWRRSPARGGERPEAVAGSDARANASTDVLLVAELSDHLPAYTWGAGARVAIRALSLGYGIAATMHAERLEDVFERLRAEPVRLSDDELSRLGVVLILRDGAASGGHARRRVVAAHYVRPLARDQHGHVQRMPPAVLAARDSRTDELEHFAWGVMPELAARIGDRAGDLEQEQRRRADLLSDLANAGLHHTDDVHRAIAGAEARASHP